MQVTIELPEDLAQQLQEKWGDVPRHLLETAAVEGYRSGELTRYQVRLMLAFETRMEVDAFLKEAGIYRDYTETDLEEDRKTLQRY